MTSINVALQGLATLFLAGAITEYNAHNLAIAIGLGIVGIVAYAVYELLPPKQS